MTAATTGLEPMRRSFKFIGWYRVTTKSAADQQPGLIQRVSNCMSGFLTDLADTHDLFQLRSDWLVWCTNDAERSPINLDGIRCSIFAIVGQDYWHVLDVERIPSQELNQQPSLDYLPHTLDTIKLQRIHHTVAACFAIIDLRIVWMAKQHTAIELLPLPVTATPPSRYHSQLLH